MLERFNSARLKADERWEELFNACGVYEYVFMDETAGVVKGVLLPDSRACQWEHTYYYKNSDLYCDYAEAARKGTWTASPIYIIDENTPDPLGEIKLEPYCPSFLVPDGWSKSSPYNKRRPVGIWRKIMADAEMYDENYENY